MQPNLCQMNATRPPSASLFRSRSLISVAALTISATLAGCGDVPSAAIHAKAPFLATASTPLATPQDPLLFGTLGSSGSPILARLASLNDPLFLTLQPPLQPIAPLSFYGSASSVSFASEDSASVDPATASPANGSTSAGALWPIHGSDMLAALSGAQLVQMPQLFDSCPTSPEVAKKMARDIRNRQVSQAVVAAMSPSSVAVDPSVESLSALFEANVQSITPATASSRARLAPFAGELAAMRVFEDSAKPTGSGSRSLSVGALAFNIRSTRLVSASGVDDWRAVAASGLKGTHWAFNPAAMPLGVRNRNPGNLRDRNTGGFQQFDTFEQGIHAADMNLLDYGVHHNITTIQGIVNRWAPAGDGDNNPQIYAAAVSKSTGIAVDETIDLRNARVRQRILAAMFDVESPGWRVAMQQPDTAFASLGNKLPRRKASNNAPTIAPAIPASDAQPDTDADV